MLADASGRRFALCSLYGRTGLGLRKDAGYLAFLTATAVRTAWASCADEGGVLRLTTVVFHLRAVRNTSI